MKKIIGLFITICSLVLLYSDCFAISDKSIRKALVPFSEDLKRISPKIKKLSVYGIPKDKAGRYNENFVQRLIEKAIEQNKRFTIVSRENLKESLKEMELSATGAINYSSVKELGKVSGVDAFIFAYPSVSGRGDRRITILVKAVEVATGAIIFVDEYSYEKKPFFNLIIGAKFPVYSGYDINAKVKMNNPNKSEYNWDLSGQMSYSMGVIPELMIGFNLPKIDIGVRCGIVMEQWDAEKISKYPEKIYINDVEYAKATVYGFETSTAPFIFVGLSLPCSSFFGDQKDLSRLRVGYGFCSISLGGGGGLTTYTTLGREENEEIRKVSPSVSLSFIRIGMDFALASSINFLVDVDIFSKWDTKTSTTEGITYYYSGTAGPQVSIGLSYKIF